MAGSCSYFSQFFLVDLISHIHKVHVLNIENKSQEEIMRRYTFILLISFLPLSAQIQDSAAIVELRESISKIVDTKALESKERLDWEERKKEMEALLDLHVRELALLSEELEKAGQSAPGHDESTASIKEEMAALKASRRLASEAVSRNLPRVIALSALFPLPLLTETNPELAAIRAWKANDEPREALQSILAILTKAHQFNRRFIRSKEIRDKREVDVLYLGLASAFYAGADGVAGIGYPAAGGWVWKSRPEIRSELIKSLEIIDKKRPPSMVTLPLSIR